jgi:TonB family protein
VLNQDGNVIDSEVVTSSGSSQLNNEAVEAARKMKFRVPEGKNRYTVVLKIKFRIE